MSLIKCATCNRLVSDQAPVCPNCGTPFGTNAASPIGDETTRLAENQQPYQPQQQYPGQQVPQPYYEPYQSPQKPASGGGMKIALIALIAALSAMLVGGGVYYYLNSRMVAQMQEQELKAYADSIKAMESKVQAAESGRIAAEKVAEDATATAKKQKQSRSQSQSYRSGVVVDGVHVRLRYGPGKEYSIYPNDYNPIYPKKGSVLTYLDDYGDWYQVSYNGETLYISKQYSYLQW